MANSRKSYPLNSHPSADVTSAFERALEAILARVDVSDAKTIAVAYSGGLDSAALLHLAAAYCRSHHISLLAFHVHHGLSADADHWLVHAQQQCQRLGLAFDARKVDIDAGVNASHDHGVEHAARMARYAALGDMCVSHGIRLLLTAHHQDDQAETVMLQWLRGAGLPGHSGMGLLQQPHKLLPASVALGRPLLECSRAGLEQFALSQQINSIVDGSNSDTRYRRNALRHDIFPVMERHFPGFKRTLARSSRHVHTAQRLLDELAHMDLENCADNETLNLSRVRLLTADRTDNLLRYWVHEKTGSYPSEMQLAELHQQMLFAADDVHPMMLIAGWCFERYHHALFARRMTSAQSDLPPEDELLLQWQGEAKLEIPAWRGQLIFEEQAQPGLQRHLLLQGPLILKPRAGSERLKPDSNRPSRSLKKLFQEGGIPMRDRAWLPLLYVGEQLVFVAGLGIDSRAATGATGISLRWEWQAVE